MAELAVNQYGETFVVSQEATHWMVRRMADALRGGPLPTFDADGRPIVIPIETTLTQFHEILRSHGCTPGKYRLDPVDQAGRPLKGTPAYLPFPPGRKTAPVTRGDEGAATERPRNGNVPSMPMTAPTPPWSTGGAFPLPVPMHLTGAEYLFGEQMRAHMNIQSFQVQAQAAQANAQAQVIVQLATQMGGLMNAAADLLRAADGASLPRRKPMAERDAPPPRMPQVIVQQVAPPMAYDDSEDEDDDGGDEPEPAKPPAWTDKLSDVFTELAPMAKMMLQNKLADLVGGGGGGDLGGLGAILGGAMPPANAEQRNAAPTPAPVEPVRHEPEIDPIPDALDHLGCVIEQLSSEPAGRALRDELRLMDPEARVAFALDLLALPIEDACEEAIAKVAGIRVRRTRAMIAAERARGGEVTTREYDGSDLVSYDHPPVEADSASETATEAGALTDEPVTYSETTEEPGDAIPTPGYEHVRTTTGPNGHRVSHYRPIDEAQAGARATQRASVALTAPSAAPIVGAAPIARRTARGTGAQSPTNPGTGLAAMVQTIQTNRDAALANVINAFPGGAAGIEASLGQLPPDVAAQFRTALGGMTPSSSPTTALSAPIAPAARVTLQAALARMNEISPHLAPEEMATAQVIAASLPADKRSLLMAKLVAVPLAEAVAIVKDILATHAALGNPYR